MTKKLLAGFLSLILLLGILTVYLPTGDANAATLCANSSRSVSTKTSFSLRYLLRIAKNPTTTVPTQNTTPSSKPEKEVEPTPAPEKQPGSSKPETNQGSTSEQPTTSTESSLSQYELKVVELVNAERQKNGLKPLTIDEKLSQVARLKSADMRDNNYFSHQSPTYGSPFDMMKKFGISYRTAGENIAAGQRTPEAVVQAWMNSSGHRANILNANFTHIGVGYVQGDSYGTYWTQQFIGK